MSLKKAKDDICRKAVLKWRRFLRATEKPTVKTRSDISVSICASDGAKADLIDASLDSEIALRDLLAATIVISFACSLLRVLFGRK